MLYWLRDKLFWGYSLLFFTSLQISTPWIYSDCCFMSCNGTIKHSLFNFSIAGLNFSFVLSNRPFFLCMRSSVVSELYVICPIQLVLSAGILSESSWKAKNREFRLDSANGGVYMTTHWQCWNHIFAAAADGGQSYFGGIFALQARPSLSHKGHDMLSTYN